MNHIHRLQNEVLDLNDQLLRKNERVREFMRHINSQKFAKEQANGERGDWIATGDVQKWLRYIEDLGLEYP
jgi:hypothetical protein